MLKTCFITMFFDINMKIWIEIIKQFAQII